MRRRRLPAHRLHGVADPRVPRMPDDRSLPGGVAVTPTDSILVALYALSALAANAVVLWSLLSGSGGPLAP